MIQYVIGLFVMAFGIVLIKKADVGVSPIAVIPSALADLFPFTFGNMLILFQVICFILIFVVQRTVNLKTILILPVAIAFGYIIDLHMFLLPIEGLAVWWCYVVCLAGIAGTALGIVIIVGTDLMLPAPDALIRAISAEYDKPLPGVKVAGDACFVAIAVVIELSCFHQLRSVWIGTVLSVILTGRLVGVFGKRLPWLKVKKEQDNKKACEDTKDTE